MEYWDGAGKCGYAASGFAVLTDNSGASAYTTDANCQKLGTVITQCVECMDNYYWDTTVCKLFASLVAGGFLFIFGLFIN